MPKLSVIIPTLNESKYLPKLLGDLRRQTFQDFEVIVADANSIDGTAEIAQDWGAKVVKGGMTARARNNGVNFAEGDLLVFLDADVRFGTDFLEKIVISFQEKGFDFAMPRIGSQSQDWRDRFIFWWHDFYLRRSAKTKPMTLGPSTIVRRDIFEKAGGYDESLVLGEDVELGFRVWKMTKKFSVIETWCNYSERRYVKQGRVRTCFKYMWSGVLQNMGIHRRNARHEALNYTK